MSKTHADSIFELPQDIIFNILSRLTTKSLIRFRCVCTSSRPLISHPCFIKLHLTSTVANDHRIIISYDSIHERNHFYSLLSPLTFKETRKLQFPCNDKYRGFVGSSKGLICLFDSSVYSSSGTLVLWNPSINKYKILDGPHVSYRFLWRNVLGFGFVLRTCDFKIIVTVWDEVFVYSLSTNSWEKKKGVSAPYCFTTSARAETTYVNGFVNWLASKEYTSRVIVAFDLDHEQFRVLELPKDVVPNHGVISIDSFGEEDYLSLSLCVRYHDYGFGKLNVWVMEEYGVVDSWKKVFVISHNLLLQMPLLLKNEREILILKKDGKLILFDAIRNEMRDLTRDRLGFSHAIRYTASLALLHG